ncbi:hypothetical protein YPPY64_3092, partial [Yersinia pestis PY-64]
MTVQRYNLMAKGDNLTTK